MNNIAVTFNRQSLFQSGPHQLTFQSPQRDSRPLSTPGRDGIRWIDDGARGRAILQQGRLTAPDSSRLAELLTRIESYLDGLAYPLTDALGRTHDKVRMVRFSADPIQNCGRLVSCRYRIEYFQSV